MLIHGGEVVWRNPINCEIQTKKGSVPKKDWLGIVKTARARSKIRHYLREKGIVA